MMRAFLVAAWVTVAATAAGEPVAPMSVAFLTLEVSPPRASPPEGLSGTASCYTQRTTLPSHCEPH